MRSTEGGAIRTIDLSKNYAGLMALQDVNATFLQGRVTGLIGPNGAGKTTLVNLLTGFDRPSTGQIEMDGHQVASWSPRKRVRHGMARTFQNARLFGELTVFENVEVSALAAGRSRREARSRAAELLEKVQLTEFAQFTAHALPYGHQRILSIARALCSGPRYLFLDEPAAGVDEVEVPIFLDLLRSLRDEHLCGVVLIEHNMDVVFGSCDEIVVLDHGAVIASGTPEQIRNDPLVISAYLGDQMEETAR